MPATDEAYRAPAEPDPTDRHSYRKILASTSIIGSATLASIVVGIVRTKALALIAGPAGIGVIGLLNNISGIGTNLAGLGLCHSVTRDIAASPGPAERAEVRRALWLATMPAAILGGLVLWLLRAPIARLVAGDQGLALLVGLSGLAVTFGAIAFAQQGVLQGLQRIRALGIIRIGSPLLATLLAIPAAYWWGEIGLVVAVVAVPLAAVLVGLLYAPRDLPAVRVDRAQLLARWDSLLRLGAVMMVTGLINLSVLAAVRAFVVRDGGLEAAGQFQAVITLTTMNIALVLSAMASDYFPRLSAEAGLHSEQNRIVNQQLHSALLLAVPLILGLIAFAPFVMRILYSSQFLPGTELLRWQLFGDVLKVPSWALGFVLLANGNRRAFFATEILYATVYLAGSYVAVSSFGMRGVGLAYSLAFLAYAIALQWVCRRDYGIAISRENMLILLVSAAVIGLLQVAATFSQWLVFGLGLAAAAASGLFTLRELSRKTGIRLPFLGTRS
ncbi:O-antigen translocase [Sphingomonas astaxanthinifaciens]|uniref:O-antigen translocase n=1 Tax=Sphingomonas astaxanthinifaciens DSM 22298 TaxID=1123267 RepID=A0ABQ5Z5Q6_9SPHN|nr:O-antigen translocase [Sphingomonas astaxanthinifaciens]GLR46970.1 O-antigen translocase [Sphingomonas astaxanthinifaciens DSM 22298]